MLLRTSFTALLAGRPLSPIPLRPARSARALRSGCGAILTGCTYSELGSCWYHWSCRGRLDKLPREMLSVLTSLLLAVRAFVRTRAALQAQIAFTNGDAKRRT